MLRFATVLAGVVLAVPSAWSGPVEREIAQRVDLLIAAHLAEASVTPAPEASDEDFLRRVHLDLRGSIPSPAQVRSFIANTDPNKRQAVIDELLASPEFAETWASYWKEVVYLRATEQRSRQAEPVFKDWLEEQFATDRPWNEMARDMITATGNTTENGATGLVFAQGGVAEEVAAEMSRIFMGIQISCANCHDHPTDQWKREQFHQLAAYLPRITVRPEEIDGVRTFAVSSLDSLPGRRGARAMQNQDNAANIARLITRFDRNRDGKISKAEVGNAPFSQQFDRILQNADSDKDGQLSRAELEAGQMQVNQQPGRGSLEHYMPDLNNPASRGQLVDPKFFIAEVKGPDVYDNASDQARRSALASFITSPENPWFARAFVNRIWAEMLGTGFYMPIDDMGPDRAPVYGDVLDALAQGFVDSGYNVKWLYRTIANTEAYQRKMSSTEAYPAAFASISPTRLRGDQVYNSLSQVVGSQTGRGRAGRAGRRGALNRPEGQRGRRGAANNPDANPAVNPDNPPAANAGDGANADPAGRRGANNRAGRRGAARRGANPELQLELGAGNGDTMNRGEQMEAMNSGNAMTVPEQMPAQPAGRRGPLMSPEERQREQFAELFGFDPSTPQEDILGTIPQALFLMNAPQVDRRIQGFGQGTLGPILRQNPRNDAAIREVYLLALSRYPSDSEVQIATDYIAESSNRNEGMEDLLWSLVNSTEFISKR